MDNERISLVFALKVKRIENRRENAELDYGSLMLNVMNTVFLSLPCATKGSDVESVPLRRVDLPRLYKNRRLVG